jgi:Bacterial SH3 domain
LKRNLIQLLAICTLTIGLANCNDADSGSSSSPQPNAPAQPSPQQAPQNAPEPSPESDETARSSLTPPTPIPAAPQTTGNGTGNATNPTPEIAQNPSPATLETLSCTITMAVVNDPNAPLRVRSTPNANTANNIVGQLENGAFVTVEGEANGWLQISEPMRGWISKKLTDNGCNQKVARVNFPPGSTAFRLTDRIIGSGSHRYQFNATQGQMLAIASESGPLPFIINPDGTALTDASNHLTSWQQVLPANGQYVLQFDSNFRGFSYDVSIELR